jgi:hypothetical protein
VVLDLERVKLQVVVIKALVSEAVINTDPGLKADKCR